MANNVTDSKCPGCSQPVYFKEDASGLTAYNFNGAVHTCFKEKPIGQAVVGRLIEGFNLRERTAIITLDGGAQMEIHSLGYKPLKLRLITRDGILEE